MQEEKTEPQLEYSELIKDWKIAVSEGFGKISLALDYHAGPPWLDVRDKIEKLGLGTHPDVIKHDIELIKTAITWKTGGTYESEDHPLSYWWWHLDKIARKEYPAELLPEHLRKIYLSL